MIETGHLPCPFPEGLRRCPGARDGAKFKIVVDPSSSRSLGLMTFQALSPSVAVLAVVAVTYVTVHSVVCLKPYRI